MPGRFLRQQLSYLSPDTIVFSDEVMTPAVCWFANRRDVKLLGESGELEYGLKYPDSADRFLPTDQFETFRRQNPESRITLVTRLRDYHDEYEDVLSKPAYMKTSDGFLLVSYAPKGTANSENQSLPQSSLPQVEALPEQ